VEVSPHTLLFLSLPLIPCTPLIHFYPFFPFTLLVSRPSTAPLSLRTGQGRIGAGWRLSDSWR
jgi:hypothetical protein